MKKNKKNKNWQKQKYEASNSLVHSLNPAHKVYKILVRQKITIPKPDNRIRSSARSPASRYEVSSISWNRAG
jgi:hypothetical protein